jgi:hypothetical protein
MARAFTYRPKKILREIIIETGVSIPYIPKGDIRQPKIIKVKALWDTGATNCVITTDLIAKLGVKPFTITNVIHGGGTEQKNVYKINIYLPNQVCIPLVNATEGIVNGSFDLIIGMDIITMGDFSVSNFNKETVVSFRLPSAMETDYVNESNIQNAPKVPIIAEEKQGRNDPCHCGSGKKYKYCHGKK